MTRRPASGRCIASAMATVLGITLSATAAAPVVTIVTDFRRAIRIVLRFKRTFLTLDGNQTAARTSRASAPP
ncbi:hypothetical protein AQJ58_32815 [Streptomyces sp. DSM 15324]|nr:hypothetical protein AQJ58_32815 [Streptomyces sp. DSM 15324]